MAIPTNKEAHAPNKFNFLQIHEVHDSWFQLNCSICFILIILRVRTRVWYGANKPRDIKDINAGYHHGSRSPRALPLSRRIGRRLGLGPLKDIDIAKLEAKGKTRESLGSRVPQNLHSLCKLTVGGPSNTSYALPFHFTFPFCPAVPHPSAKLATSTRTCSALQIVACARYMRRSAHPPVDRTGLSRNTVSCLSLRL